MGTRNTTENKRFVFRSPEKKPTAYLVSAEGSEPHVVKRVVQSQVTPKTEVLSSPPPPTLQASINTNTPRTEGAPARRIVVIRNTKHPQVKQGPVDLGDFGQPNSPKIPPVASNGHTSVYLIRRPIVPSEPTTSVN